MVSPIEIILILPQHQSSLLDNDHTLTDIDRGSMEGSIAHNDTLTDDEMLSISDSNDNDEYSDSYSQQSTSNDTESDLLSYVSVHTKYEQIYADTSCGLKGAWVVTTLYDTQLPTNVIRMIAMENFFTMKRNQIPNQNLNQKMNNIVVFVMLPFVKNWGMDVFIVLVVLLIYAPNAVK